MVIKYCNFLKKEIKIIDIPQLYSACEEGLPRKGSTCNNTRCVYHNVNRMFLLSKEVPPEKMNQVAELACKIDYTDIDYAIKEILFTTPGILKLKGLTKDIQKEREKEEMERTRKEIQEKVRKEKEKQSLRKAQETQCTLESIVDQAEIEFAKDTEAKQKYCEIVDYERVKNEMDLTTQECIGPIQKEREKQNPFEDQKSQGVPVKNADISVDLQKQLELDKKSEENRKHWEKEESERIRTEIKSKLSGNKEKAKKGKGNHQSEIKSRKTGQSGLKKTQKKRDLQETETSKNKKSFIGGIIDFFTRDNTQNLKNSNPILEKQWEASHWLEVGAMAAEQNRWQEAVVCYDKAISISPNNASFWKCKAGALHCLHRFDEATVCINKSLSLDPNDSDARTLKRIIDAKIWIF